MISRLFALPVAIGELIWRRSCHVCDGTLAAHQHYICDVCAARLPRVPIGSYQLADRLSLMCQPSRAHAWLFYGRHEESRHLLHDIKYRGCRRLARYLGRAMAWELQISGVFNGVEAIVPVPLHIFRYLHRGYNQSMELAHGVGEVTHIPVVNVLRAHRHRTQTRLSRDMRASNVQGKYYLPKSVKLDYAHILLIDDVCTTGATLRSCIEAIRSRYPEMQISVLTLALTR